MQQYSSGGTQQYQTPSDPTLYVPVKREERPVSGGREGAQQYPTQGHTLLAIVQRENTAAQRAYSGIDK